MMVKYGNNFGKKNFGYPPPKLWMMTQTITGVSFFIVTSHKQKHQANLFTVLFFEF